MPKRKSSWTEQVKTDSQPDNSEQQKLAESFAEMQNKSQEMFELLFGKNEELDRQMAESYAMACEAVSTQLHTEAAE